jgi:hypothetical protein
MEMEIKIHISKSGSLNLQEPSGPVPRLYRNCFTFASHTACTNIPLKEVL